MAQKFCPKCGAPRTGSEKFCSKCGAEFEQTNSQKTATMQDSQQPSQRRSQQTRSHQPMSKNKKIGLSCLGVVVVAIIGFIIWGNNYYSTSNQIDRIAQIMSSTDKDATGVVKSNDPNLKVTEKNIKPLQKYFVENKDELSSMVSNISNGVSYHGISLVKDGHYCLFFPKYKLAVPAAYADVTTNHAGSKVYVDGKNVGTVKKIDGGYSKHVGPYFPGIHTFQVKATVSGRNIKTNEDTAEIWGNDNYEEMEITTASFKIKGIPGATVLLDGKDQGKLDGNGEMKFKNYPITKGLTLQIQFDSNGKTITSKKMNVYNNLGYGTSTLSPKFAGVISEDEAQSLLTQAFNQYAATSDNNAELYQNEENNSDYKDVRNMFKGFDDNDKNNSYSTEVSIKSITPAGDGKSNVIFEVKYVFNRSDDTELVQVMEYNGCVIEKNPDKNASEAYLIDTIGKGKMTTKQILMTN